MGLEGQRLGRDRGDEQPARLEVLVSATQERRAALGSAEEVDRLHGNDDEREAPAEVEVAGVGLDHVHRQVAGPATQLREQLAIAVQGRHLVPAPGQVERHAARARPDIQDRPARLLGELTPEREVGRVFGALHVVPDDRLRPGHAGAITRSARWRVVTVAGSSAIGSPSAYIVKGRSAEIRTSRARTTCTDGDSCRRPWKDFVTL